MQNQLEESCVAYIFAKQEGVIFIGMGNERECEKGNLHF